MNAKDRPRGQSGQFARMAETATSLAKEYGVSERTIRRDAEFAWAVDFLGLGARVMAGEGFSRQGVIDAAHLRLGKLYNEAVKAEEAAGGGL